MPGFASVGRLKLRYLIARARYFAATGNPILKGRGISEQDTATSQHVAVINEAFARKFFKNEDPIGKYFGRTEMASRLYEVVGIVKDARYLTIGLDQPIGPFFFLPAAQHDVSTQGEHSEVDPGTHFLHDIVIVTKPQANLSFESVRHAMASVDPNLPISIRTLKDQVAGQFTQHEGAAQIARAIF